MMLFKSGSEKLTGAIKPANTNFIRIKEAFERTSST